MERYNQLSIMTMPRANRQFSLTLESLSTPLRQVSAKLREMAAKPLVWLRDYYSGVCGKSLSMGQTHLLNVTQLAFIAAVFPVYSSLLLRVVACGVFALLLRRCKAVIK